MGDWLAAPLSNFLTRITYGFTNPMPTTQAGPYMITARDINDGRILYEQARSTSEEAFSNKITDKSRPDVGDVLVTKDGTLGRIAIVDRENVCINQSVALLKPANNIRTRFLKYLLEEPRNFYRMLNDADGTTIKHIYITRLAKMVVVVPSVEIQDNIVGLLGALDDKIELNRRTNETLEATSRAIFKDWFVNFGPTRSKMEARAPYLTPEIWSLFPNRLDNEGKPEGWRAEPLDRIATFLNGLALQKFPGTGVDDLPVIKIAELRAGITASSGRASAAIPKQYVIEDGDILFSWSGTLMQRIWSGGRGALNQHLFKVTSKFWPKWLHYLWVDHHLPMFLAIAAGKATTMGHIQRHHLSEAQTLLGDDGTMKAANELIGPLFQKVLATDLETRTLAATRDLLLPKLMTGEVQMRDAEKLVQAAL